MAVGRFSNRAEALDFLVEKFSTKEHPARYSLLERETARVTLNFMKEFGHGKKGEVQYVGNGADLSAAIVDLFKHLDVPVDADPKKETPHA